MTVINFTGWREIVWNLPTDAKTRFAGSGDNAFTGNLRLDSLYVTKSGASVSGNLYFDEATYRVGVPTSPGTAAIQFSGTYQLVHLAFPFEAINAAQQREQIMANALNFLDEGFQSGVADWSMY